MTDVPPQLRVAVVFRSPMMRRGCAGILANHPGIVVTVVDEYDAIGADAIEDCDVAVVGMVGGADAGGRTVRRLADRGVHVLVVLPPGVSGDAAASVGAAGFVNGATVDESDLVAAVLAVARGPVPDVARHVLSARERTVLVEVANGATDREVGDRLGISMRTVQSHLDRIREKTGRRRRAELTRLAFELGLSTGGDDEPE